MVSCINTANKKEKLTFKGLKIFYKSSDTLVFKIKNSTHLPVDLSVGVEGFYNKKWRILINDIDYPYEGLVHLQKLPKKSEKEFSFKLKEMNELFSDYKTFRLFIEYSTTKNVTKKEKVLSKEFEVQL